jgi:hypothetical protein
MLTPELTIRKRRSTPGAVDVEARVGLEIQEEVLSTEVNLD